MTILKVSGQDTSRYFNFKEIQKSDFTSAFKDNFNALSQKTVDSTRMREAFKLIDKSYKASEIDLALNELCDSPRCLTSFLSYYPQLDILHFAINDFHHQNAVFFDNKSNNIMESKMRFYGSYGVMSQKGQWVGLKREGSDNYLQIEISQLRNNIRYVAIAFEFKSLDLNTAVRNPIFWVDESTIYMSVIEYDPLQNKSMEKFYKLKFNH